MVMAIVTVVGFILLSLIGWLLLKKMCKDIAQRHHDFIQEEIRSGRLTY